MKSSPNHIFRTIWSEALNIWVAVSEITRVKDKRSGSCAAVALAGIMPGLRVKPLITALACSFCLNAQANPTGAQIINGTVSTSYNGNQLTVTNTPNAIINWQGFSIGQGETTSFIQQSASSSILNRVIGPDPSLLLGTMTSNGRVFLINPAGIMVGQGARIDVGAFVASTLNLSNADFMAGNLNFGSTLNAGSVSNHGTINTPSGGSVYLVAPHVVNNGIITTPQGETILAAGNTVQILDSGTPGVSVQITGSATSATNLGQILADSGRIGMVGAAVRNSGQLNASSLVRIGGRVFLKATQTATVDAGSSIDATGSSGGTVEVLGNQVSVSGTINASGSGNGGTILIGGDAHGANPLIQNAQNTFVSSTASINADGGVLNQQSGNGGKVVVWADNTTQFSGNISAQGGARGGNGGWVEVSGRQRLGFAGLVNTLAPQGVTGSLLLDPTDITISAAPNTPLVWNLPTLSYTGAITPSNLNVTTLQTQLGLSNVVIDTTSALLGVGNITIQDSIAWASGFGLTLNATGLGSIVVNATNLTGGLPLSITNTGLGGLTMNTAGGGITIGGAVNLGGGAFTANTLAGIGAAGGGAININAAINTGAGAVNLNAGGTILEGLAGSIAAASLTTSAIGGTTLNGANAVSSFSATDTGAVSLTNTALLLGLNASTSAGFTVSNTGAIAVNGLLNSGFGAATLTASTDLNVALGGITSTGAVNLNFGAVAGKLTLAAPVNGRTVTATGGAATDTLAVIDNAATTTLGASSLARTGSTLMNFINIGSASLTGGAAANVIDASLFVGAVTINDTAGGDTIRGNGATTTLVGQNIANAWNITAADAGNIGALTNFTGVGNITGGALADTFTLAGGTLSGVITGGGGADILGGAVAGALNFAGGNTSSLTINALTAGSLGVTGAAAIGIAGALNAAAGAVNLASTGAITEAIGGSITAGLLTTSSAGGTVLNGANTVSSFNATNITSGNIELTNNAALNITGISNTAANSLITVNDTVGLLTTSGAINGVNSVTLNSAGGLTIGAGGVKANMSTGTVNLTASNGAIIGAGNAAVPDVSANTLIISSPLAPIGTILAPLNTAVSSLTFTSNGGANFSNQGGYGMTYIGSWRVDQGPLWTTVPLAYTGQQAAALLFGGVAADYSISTVSNLIAAIDYMAWYSIWGWPGGTKFAQNYVAPGTGPFYQNIKGYVPTNTASAYVWDNAQGVIYTNYAFRGGSKVLTVNGTDTSLLANTSVKIAQTNGDLVAGVINAAGKTVNLTSSGKITQIGAITTGTLITSAIGGTTLNGANAVSNFSATDTGAISLTNTVALGLNAINSAGLSITNIGGTTINGLIANGVSAVNLTDTGLITEAAGGSITAGILTTSAIGGTTLNGLNAVSRFGATDTGAVSFNNTVALGLNAISSAGLSVTNIGGTTINGLIANGVSAVNLTDTGLITEAAGGSITAGALTTIAAGGTTLNGANAVSRFGATDTGAVIFNNTVALGLNAISSAGLSVTNIGGTTINGLIANGVSAVNLTDTGLITEAAGGSITAGILTTLAAGGTTLNGANAVSNFSATDTGAVSLNNTIALALNAINSAGLTVVNIGGTTISGLIANGVSAVNLTNTGLITEAAGGSITAGLLSTSSVGGTILNGANRVGSFNATNITGGNIELINTSNPLTLNALSNTGGNVVIDNTGAIIVAGALSSSGNFDMIAHSPITINNGASINATGNLRLTAGAPFSTATTDIISIFGTISGASVNLAANRVAGNIPAGAVIQSPVLAITPVAAVVQQLATTNTNPPIIKPSDIPAMLFTNPTSPSLVNRGATIGGTVGTFGAEEPGVVMTSGDGADKAVENGEANGKDDHKDKPDDKPDKC